MKDYEDELERDFPLRSMGNLQITNLRGGVVVQGWALDKIRVRARRRARAASPEEAKRLFTALDVRFRAGDGQIELSAEYGRNLDIHERLRERQQPHTAMDIVVQAPANLPLRAWTTDGAVSVRNWNSDFEVRTARGAVRIDNSKSGTASVLCHACTIVAKGVKGGLRCMGGEGDVDIQDVNARHVYVETSSGAQRLARIDGEQLYVSKSGAISGHDLRGHVEFHTVSGAVAFSEASGFVSGRTETGAIDVSMREWKFIDKALIESVKGSIRLALPSVFSGEVDVRSQTGKARVAFPLETISDDRFYGPEPPNHLRGRIGAGGEQLRVFTLEGDVQVLKGT